MRFGFHVSIAGDLSKAAERAARLSCQTIQIFAGNPRSWESRDLDSHKVVALREALVQEDISPLFVHMPYLPNPAAEDDVLYRKSLQVLCEMLRRSAILGAKGLVLHLGHYGREGEVKAVRRVAAAVRSAMEAVPNEVMILLENTAGQGTEIGWRFETLARLVKGIGHHGRVGVCLDTAHAFAAGYDLSTPDGLESMLEEFSKEIGWKRLRLIHLNDAKARLGSRVDRHWHIGEGFIGREGMRRIITHPFLSALPAIMETPKKRANDDIKNMQMVRSLAAG